MKRRNSSSAAVLLATTFPSSLAIDAAALTRDMLSRLGKHLKHSHRTKLLQILCKLWSYMRENSASVKMIKIVYDSAWRKEMVANDTDAVESASVSEGVCKSRVPDKVKETHRKVMVAYYPDSGCNLPCF
ncbi:hypothetical protein FEM48_Zijuj03G0085600 [Ziziphus jujuba var. spinosa]|uniref:Uncharacterized protein n=1 Tax=Ziziphus jujuba var. spinosa TaxID=714518 RepID=A0A978VP98_ZIZJJ|nr:hypothetical protein FEM48_Zijuj03G0085600 [Ziziphus jujuba var. spinosa]